MKNNKLFKWLYGIFMFLPMLAIGVCCAYVTFNKNAKDSYYGETINQVTYENVTTYDSFKTNEDYRFTLQTNQVENNSGSAVYYDNINIVDTNISDIGDLTLYESFTVTWADNRQYISFRKQGLTTLTYNSVSQRLVFDFTLISFSKGANQNLSFTDKYNGDIVSINYNKYSYLDNAFYYAIDKFNECGFNKVDFVSFFDFFNTQNNIYITFVNTYINYMLFVSLAFFIPRVLMWFIGFAYGLTDTYSGRSLW